MHKPFYSQEDAFSFELGEMPTRDQDDDPYQYLFDDMTVESQNTLYGEPPITPAGEEMLLTFTSLSRLNAIKARIAELESELQLIEATIDPHESIQ